MINFTLRRNCLPCFLSFVLCFILPGCNRPKRTVDAWLDQEIAGRAPYEVKGVTGYKLVAYKIIKSSNQIVTVELTFKNQRGGDLVETHNFRLNKDRKVEMVK